MLSDNSVDPVNPPDGELDGPAVESDHTHRILIDELNPIPRLKYINSLVGSSCFSLIRSSSFVNISFIAMSPFISNSRYLLVVSSILGISGRDSGSGVLTLSWMALLVIEGRHTGVCIFFHNVADCPSSFNVVGGRLQVIHVV